MTAELSKDKEPFRQRDVSGEKNLMRRFPSAGRTWRHERTKLTHIAPVNILAEDFRELDSHVILRTAWHIEQLVLIQSVTSHAHMGHGVFHGRKYPNTTEDDTARALRLDPNVVKIDRQQLIDEVMEYAERAVHGEADETLLNEYGEPLMRIGSFRNIRVDPKGVLQGLYLGGLRDSPETRAATEQKYGIKIGWGKCYLVNKKVMEAMGFNGEILARKGHGEYIEEYHKTGLITNTPGKDVAYMYIRYKVGPGASDDAAVISAGKLYGYSAAVGTFLADAIDTLEKYAVKTADQDFEIANHIAEICPDLGVGPDDACRIAYLAAAPEGREHEVPDSSLRGLLEVDRKFDICALESHLLYVEGKPVPEIELDHGQSTNMKLYNYINERLDEEKKRSS
jgi:hypothetical protein